MKSGLSSLAALLPGVVASALWVASARADVVTDWNVIANALVAKDVGNNPKLRTLAMVHVAMSDAINTIHNRYTKRPNAENDGEEVSLAHSLECRIPTLAVAFNRSPRRRVRVASAAR